MDKVNSSWETMEQLGSNESRCFKLQRMISSLPDDGYLFKVKHTVQSILQPQNERFWKIICHTRTTKNCSDLLNHTNTIILATSRDMKHIKQYWEMIQSQYSQLLSQIELLDNEREQREFIEMKLGSFLLTDNNTNSIDKHNQQSHFKELFQDLIPENHDTILTWYSCSFSKKQNKKHQGWMYILFKFVCLYSYYFGDETKWIIELKNVTLIKKTKAFHGFFDNAIIIRTLNDAEYHISNLFHRNEAYDLIHQLCHDALHEKMISTSMSPLSVSSDTLNSNSSATHQAKKMKLFQEFFRLPDNEEPRTQQTIPCRCSKDGIIWIQGYSYLSGHYFCFVAVPTSYEIKMVLPLYIVKKMEKLSSNNKEELFSCLKITLLSLKQSGQEIHIYLALGFTESGEHELYQDQFHFALQENSEFTKNLLMRYKKSNIIDWESSIGLGEYYGYPMKDHIHEEQYSLEMLLVTSIGDLRSTLISNKGFANSKRGWIWSFLCGSWFEYIHNNAIISFIEQNNDTISTTKAISEDIEKDLHRSLPEYVAFQDNNIGLEVLRRVLTKYAMNNPGLGYCQAMNLLASILLIYMNEEMVVYTLGKLCSSYFPEYFSPSMTGAVTDQQVFLSLVKESLPTLFEHFKKHHIDISMITTPWFLSAYITQLPIFLVPCMLDWLFLEGNKILFQLGLATLKLNGEELMKMVEVGDMVDLLRRFFDTFKDQNIEFHRWIAFSRREYGLDQKKLRELRELHQLSVIHYIDDLYKQTHISSVLDKVGFERHQLEYLFQKYQTILYYKNGRFDDALLKEFFRITFPSWAVFDTENSDSVFVFEKLKHLVKEQLVSNSQMLSQSITFQQIILAVHQLILPEGTTKERMTSFGLFIVSSDTDQDYLISLSRIILFIGRNAEQSFYSELQASVSILLSSTLPNFNSEFEWIVDHMNKDRALRYFFGTYLPGSFLSQSPENMNSCAKETGKHILDQVDEFLSQLQA